MNEPLESCGRGAANEGLHCQRAVGLLQVV